MPTRQRVECACGEGRRPLFHGWRNLDRRSFLKATVFGATVRIAAARSLAPGAVALAGEVADFRRNVTIPLVVIPIARVVAAILQTRLVQSP